MHYAYPPRKSSNPAPFLPRKSRGLPPAVRRLRPRTIALIGLAFLAFLYLFTGRGSRRTVSVARHVPTGNPPAVLVTVFDSGKFGGSYVELVKENRKSYAEKHGYETFFPHVGDFDLKGAPMSWTKVVAMRAALTKFPDATYFWFVEEDALIMSPTVSVESDLMKPSNLEVLMIRDHPVVPPDSIIKTFSHLKGQDVDLVITQDKEGLSTSSFIIRNTEWARFFLETWFDPIYRSYNFQKAETHALEHIVQWHPTILSKLALVPQRTINSYSYHAKGEQYKEGDIVVRFATCARNTPASCETEQEPYTATWRKLFKDT